MRMLRIPSAYSLRESKVEISITGAPKRSGTPVEFWGIGNNLGVKKSRKFLTDKEIEDGRKKIEKEERVWKEKEEILIEEDLS